MSWQQNTYRLSQRNSFKDHEALLIDLYTKWIENSKYFFFLLYPQNIWKLFLQTICIVQSITIRLLIEKTLVLFHIIRCATIKSTSWLRYATIKNNYSMARWRNYTFIYLHVNVDNFKAIGLYKKLVFIDLNIYRIIIDNHRKKILLYFEWFYYYINWFRFNSN